MSYRIFFIGVAGSGKGTQAKPLAQFLGIPYVGTGEILRSKASENSEEGLWIKDILDQGQLVPDEKMAQLVEKRLREKDCQNGFVLDGYPRTLNQIKLFDPRFSEVFYLELPDEEAIKRMQVRGRSDDNPETVAERIRLFHQETEPITDYYRKQGILHVIDGRPIVEVIQANIRGIL
ncbi:MAG: nucleoside monophosphate kinase [Candidatus Daviesbacteria bacterium]|nr:MAG: nucleoside monophosphate kinase [Candidatus Daviesbacteria bacterium]